MPLLFVLCGFGGLGSGFGVLSVSLVSVGDRGEVR